MKLWNPHFRPLVEASLARIGAAIISHLPRRMVLTLAKVGGTLAFHVARRERRIGMANLNLVYGDSLTTREKERILKGSFQTFALTMLDLFWFGHDTVSRVRRYVRNEAPLAPELFRPHAHIGLTGHMGNWEILGLFTAVIGHPLTSVAMPLKNAVVDAMLNRRRQLTGQRVLPRQGALKELIRTLKAGGKLGMLLDQNTRLSEGGIFVDFMGTPATMSAVVGTLAARTGADVAIGFGIPLPDGRYDLIIPAILPGTLPAHELHQRITEVYARVIRQHPHHWLWTYKRWKYIPAGAAPEKYPFYARPAE